MVGESVTLFGLRIDGDVQIGPKTLASGSGDEPSVDTGGVGTSTVEIDDGGGRSAKTYGIAGLVGLVFLAVVAVIAKRKLGGGDDAEAEFLEHEGAEDAEDAEDADFYDEGVEAER